MLSRSILRYLSFSLEEPSYRDAARIPIIRLSCYLLKSTKPLFLGVETGFAILNLGRINSPYVQPCMAKNEKTSKSVASLASAVLRGVKTPTKSEIKTLAATALTQTPDKKKR